MITNELNDAVTANPLTVQPLAARPVATRVSLPPTRDGMIIKFNIQSFKGYAVLNTYDDGAPSELFLHVGKEGGTLHGLLCIVAKLVSLGLKYGIPASAIADSLSDEVFEPNGFGQVGNSEVRHYGSLAEVIAEVLRRRPVERS